MYQDKTEREIEAERARPAESYQAGVGANVAEELQRRDIAASEGIDYFRVAPQNWMHPKRLT